MSNNEALYTSGPVSTLPGSTSDPKGSVCDTHPDRPAVKRVQGETDSFGCEYFFVCQECLDELKKEQEQERETLKYCESCKTEKKNVGPYRDPDEGMAGPLYYACGDCRGKFFAAYAEANSDLDDDSLDTDYDPLDSRFDDDIDEP